MLGVRIWQTDRTLLHLEDLFEAKETYPVGTIKQYGPVHLYVKTGGKKPWVYYATLGTEKANGAIAAGGVLVKDAKAVGAATQENQKKFGIDHPFKGQKIPALVPGVPTYPPGEEPAGQAPEYQGAPPKAGQVVLKPAQPSTTPAAPPMSGGALLTPTTPTSAPTMKAQQDYADAFKKALYATTGMTPPELLDFLKQYNAESLSVQSLSKLMAHAGKLGIKSDMTQMMGDFQLAHDLVLSGNAADTIDTIQKTLDNISMLQASVFTSLHGDDWKEKVQALAATFGLAGGIGIFAPVAVPPPPPKKHKHSVPASGSTSLSAAPTPPPPPTAGVQAPGGQAKLDLKPDGFAFLPSILKAVSNYGSAEDYEVAVPEPDKIPELFGKDWKKLVQLGSTLKSYGSASAMIDAAKDDDDLAKSWDEEYGADWKHLAQNVEGSLGGSAAELPSAVKPKDPEAPPLPPKTHKAKGKKAAAAASAAAVAGLGGVGAAPSLPSLPSGGGFGGGGSLPAMGSLTNPKSGKYLGGAGDKTIYDGPDGKQYLFKKATLKGSGSAAKPYAAEVQAAFSRVAKLVKPEHLEVGVAKVGGSVGTLQPLLSGATNLVGVAPAALSDSEKLDVASEHLLDWLGSQHDSFDANLLRVNGHVIGVDKEQGLRFLGDDKLSTNYKPNSDHHGEKPPYYNQFWNDWADDKFNFNPEALAPYVDQIDKIDTEAYVENYRKYAESMFPGKPEAQEELLDKVRQRKLHVRKDFEKFLTGLYHKRFATGGAGGFSFAGGWDTGVDAGPKKKKVKRTAKQQAAEDGMKEYPFKNDAGEDTTKITLKMPKSEPTEKMEQFAKKMGLKPVGPLVTGGYYHIMSFHKKDYDAAEVEMEVEVESPSKGASIQPDKPRYFPDNPKTASPKALPNAAEVKKLHELHLSRHGKRFSSDGGMVEGNCAKAKKYIGSDGKPYFLFHFKLRKPTWTGLKTKGTSGTYGFPLGKYDDSQDAIVESGSNMDTVSTRMWSEGDSELHLAAGTDKYSYMGGVYAKVKPKAGQTPAQALAELLDKAKPGLSKEVLRDPTPEERDIVRLSRLYWTLDPHGSDALDENEGDRTLVGLKEKLKKLGIKDEDLENIEEQEVLPGYSTPVLKGRWKKVAKGQLKFLENGISDTSAALSVLETGLLGIHERNLHGIPKNGVSYHEDINTGSGDGILTQPVAEAGLNYGITSQAWHKMYQAILVPDVMDRLDVYSHPSDHFGACKKGDHRWDNRSSVDTQYNGLAGSHKTGMETSFRRGVQVEKIARITCQTAHARTELIKAAKKRGLQEVNGVPIDDFIVVEDSMKDIYEKYVKPLGY
jgi:hypothetical protein